MRKTKRHRYIVTFKKTSHSVIATSYGNAVAMARRECRWPNLGSDHETGGFRGYSVQTPADLKQSA